MLVGQTIGLCRLPWFVNGQFLWRAGGKELFSNAPGTPMSFDWSEQMPKISLVLASLLLAAAARGDEPELYGTYRLISSTRQIVDTGEVLDAFGRNPSGMIMYG